MTCNSLRSIWAAGFLLLGAIGHQCGLPQSRAACAQPLRMWPISARVDKPENDDPSIVEPINLTSSAALHCASGRSSDALTLNIARWAVFFRIRLIGRLGEGEERPEAAAIAT